LYLSSSVKISWPDCGVKRLILQYEAMGALFSSRPRRAWRGPALIVLAHLPLACLSAAEPQRVDVFKRGVGSYHTYRIPAIVAAPNGDLVAFCEGRTHSAADSGDIDLLCSRSRDGGRNWTAAQLVWDDGPDTCGNPCPVVDRSTGVIWLLMTHNSGEDDERAIVARKSKAPRTVWLAASRDHGATWSKPVEITADVKAGDWTWYATGPGAGIQLERGAHAGRLVIPCDHNDARGRRYSHVIYSDDRGASWRRGQATPADQVNECEVVELTDGRLLLNMRNYDRTVPARQRAVSDDGGATWRDQRHDAALVEPICQASIRRVRWPSAAGAEAGAILFSNPADRKRRRNLTIRLSRDDGATWSAARTLYPESSAYSCLVALPDGSAGCLYEADDYRRIEFARFGLPWLE
jgi:sialidase-1